MGKLLSRIVFSIIALIVTSSRTSYVAAQSYLGSGNTSGMTVYSSDEYQDPLWSQQASAENTINGNGLLSEYFDAFRFLNQAAICFDANDGDDVMTRGFEGWIDYQLSLSPTYTYPETMSIFNIIENANGTNNFRPKATLFNYAWWQINMTNSDLLRHKVASALTEIFVISRESDLRGYGDGLADYYDMLLYQCTGNFRDLLEKVTLHACMGFYLSHLNNPKANPQIGTHPDENFAREIMQLFTIGLYELNKDGTHKPGDIATYDNDDIHEFAKVFTGLGVGGVHPDRNGSTHFGMGLFNADVTKVMIMYNDQHEQGSKQLLNGFIVPAGQTGMQDIEDALDNLFNHPNVGPFIGYRLIQRMVKSNPSPAYVSRVTDAFNGDGPYGTVRGDMKAVIKAILLDPEAREAAFQYDGTNAKLKEPLFRYTHFARMVDKINPNNYYWNIGFAFFNDTKQRKFGSPSVFNFFLPTDKPHGEINELGLVAPEFQLHNTRTSVGYINNADHWTMPLPGGRIMEGSENNINNRVDWDISNLTPLAADTEVYINWLDKYILGGAMTDKTRKFMRTTLDGLDINIQGHNALENRVRFGMYMALISPEYAVVR